MSIAEANDLFMAKGQFGKKYEHLSKKYKEDFMKKYFGGVPFDEAFKLLKEHYPEKFI